MTNFHCRKCGLSVKGTGPEQHWLCSKCRNAALTKELQELMEGENDNNYEDKNKALLKLIKKLKGFSEEDSSEPGESDNNDNNDLDYVPSSVAKENKKNVKRKLALVSPTPPKTSKKTIKLA